MTCCRCGGRAIGGNGNGGPSVRPKQLIRPQMAYMLCMLLPCSQVGVA